MNLTELKTKLEIAQNQIDEAYTLVEKIERNHKVTPLDRFNEAVDIILKWEGGYVDHPRDPGGETNYGISKRSFPNVDIKNLTRQQAKNIYRQHYWNKVRGGRYPYCMALMCFDTAVNMGVSRAVRYFQECLEVEVDGIIGPKTLQAANTTDKIQFITNYYEKRKAAYRS